MAGGRIGIAGFEISATANRAGAAVTASVHNVVWRRFHSLLRSLLIKRAGVPRGQRSVSSEIAQDATPEQQELLRRIKGIEWYHSIDLGHGMVTPGEFDHRPLLDRYCLPERLDGLRVLDVGTWDGFWAFEFERRGAAEVVATDIARRSDVDLPVTLRAGLTAEQLAIPTGRGFAVASEILGSKVRRETVSIYDLSPETVGTFDVVHLGDILLHLKNPIGALECIHSVTKGYALISEVFVPDVDRLGGGRLVEYCGGGWLPHWWKIGFNALESMIRDTGFTEVECLAKFRYGLATERGALLNHAVFKAQA